MEKTLPTIPAKRYFTIGEVSELCGVKPYVLRYWEQEFAQLKPMKRRGNRRYYQHHEVLLIRRIRELLYDQGFTISGARNRLVDTVNGARLVTPAADDEADDDVGIEVNDVDLPPPASGAARAAAVPLMNHGEARAAAPAPNQTSDTTVQRLRAELLSIRELLTV